MEKELRNLNKRISILEFFLTFSISLSLSFFYAMTNIMHIAWYPAPMLGLGIVSFSIVFLILNLVFFIINSVERVGPNLSSIVRQWKEQSLLSKIVIVLGLPSSIIGIIQTGFWLFNIISFWFRA